MYEQLISFETAKLAKEKGYDEKCVKVYNTLGQLWNAYYGFMTNSDLDSGAYCTAPSQSILQKWLREKHGLFITLLPNSEGKWGYEILTKNQIHTQGNRFEMDEIIGTYEEALEEGLKQALLLI